MLYALLKIVVKIALKVFYKKVHIQTKGPLPRTGPLIVVANHPNTFMDPLVIASMLKQQVYFLTNGSVFKSPWAAWLLKRMNMIPVYRKEDVPGKTPDNRQTFAKCWQFLSEKGSLLIFPEGSSVNERRLRKLKTGTARIALGYEAENNFQGGLRILTVGLNYSQANRFRSELFVHVDEAIEVAHFASAYQRDPYEASNALTDLIRERLESHLIITRNEEEDRLAKQVEALYGKRLAQHLELSLKDSEQEFLLTKGIVAAIHHFEEQQPQRMAALRTQVEDYWSKLERLGLRDEVMGKPERQKPGATWLSVFLTVLGFPVYLYGLLNNYIPYILPSKVARLITREEVYMAPIMMAVGIFSFSILYALQIAFFHSWAGNPWLTALYALSLPISGFFVLYYWNHLVASFHNWRFKAVLQRKQTLIVTLKEKRGLILRQLEEAKTDFLAWQEANSSHLPTDKVDG
jgi:glycerol-3-phosphate O-acyltransferase / dihydroxyacetone phosphate acyltransferase